MSILDKPVIKYFRASATEVMANEEITIEWNVENARKVRLDGLEFADKSSLNLYIQDNRIFELSATNLVGKEVQKLSVFLLTPVVLKFEADSQTIKEGEPVNLHFQLKNALHWKLMAEYTSISGNRKETVAEEKAEKSSAVFSKSISIILKGACTLSLITRNGYEKGLVETLRLSVPHLLLDMFTDREVAKKDSFVRVTWRTQNANKIILNPGNIDVTDLDHYDFLVKGNHDIQLELKASGDFGQQAASNKTIYLARVNSIYASNNCDVFCPSFYLNWFATGLHNLKLMPDGIPVHESEVKFKITESPVPVTYTLTGETSCQEEVSESITLAPCSIQYFLLEKGEVIIGSVATLSWLVKDARRVQLKFSDSPLAIDIPLSESSYGFQVFKGRDKVRLFAWGDTNLVEQEIPIPAFESPRITLFKVPTLSFCLAISWMPSPVIKAETRASQTFSIMNMSSGREKSIYYKIVGLLSAPSSLVLKRMRIPRLNLREWKGMLKPFPLVRLYSKLTESAQDNLKQNQKNHTYEENQ